jgi:hypothetical protein
MEKKHIANLKKNFKEVFKNSRRCIGSHEQCGRTNSNHFLNASNTTKIRLGISNKN